MIEFEEIGGCQTAIVRRQVRPSDLERIAKVQLLWLEPDSGELQVPAPLSVRGLQRLMISKCTQPLFDLVARDSFPALEWLVLSEAETCTSNIFEIGVLDNLKMLRILRQNSSKDILNWVALQESVVALTLADTCVSDATISKLHCRERLKLLDLWRTGVSFSVRHLFDNPFPNVRSLNVSGNRVTSSSVPTIKWLFPSLARLIADKTDLSLSDIQHIASWEGLLVLSTGNPSVDFDRYQGTLWEL